MRYIILPRQGNGRWSRPEYKENTMLLGAVADGNALAGYIAVTLELPYPHTAVMEDIFVSERYRRQYVAASLLEKAKKIVRDNGCSSLFYRFIEDENAPMPAEDVMQMAKLLGFDPLNTGGKLLTYQLSEMMDSETLAGLNARFPSRPSFEDVGGRPIRFRQILQQLEKKNIIFTDDIFDNEYSSIYADEDKNDCCVMLSEYERDKGRVNVTFMLFEIQEKNKLLALYTLLDWFDKVKTLPEDTCVEIAVDNMQHMKLLEFCFPDTGSKRRLLDYCMLL